MRAKDAARALRTERQDGDGDGDTTLQLHTVERERPLVRAFRAARNVLRFFQNSQIFKLKVKPVITQSFSRTGPSTKSILWKAELGAVVARVCCARSRWFRVQPAARDGYYDRMRPQRHASSLCLNWPQTRRHFGLGALIRRSALLCCI